MSYDRPQLVRELIRDEGTRLKVYRCTAGKRTIGVGRNLDDVGLSPGECRVLKLTLASVLDGGITEPQAMVMLGNDIDACERALDRQLSWWRRLDGVRQRVLLNMCFNLGITRLLGFRNTLAAIEAHKFTIAAAGMRASLWASQVGRRAERLSVMMATGMTVS